jgi:hypothetical protein
MLLESLGGAVLNAGWRGLTPSRLPCTALSRRNIRRRHINFSQISSAAGANCTDSCQTQIPKLQQVHEQSDNDRKPDELGRNQEFGDCIHEIPRAVHLRKIKNSSAGP